MTLHHRTVYPGLLALGLLGDGDQCQVPFQPDTDDDEYATSLTSASLLGEKEEGLSIFERWYGLVWTNIIFLFLPLRLEESVSAKPESRTMKRSISYQVLDFY
jgi:hypothetical protein